MCLRVSCRKNASQASASPNRACCAAHNSPSGCLHFAMQFANMVLLWYLVLESQLPREFSRYTMS